MDYHKWITNSAGFKFHNYYGFGAVDAEAAVNAALSYNANSLGTQNYLSWVSSGTLNAWVAEGATRFNDIAVSTTGTVEYVRIRLNFSHIRPTQMGLRLMSPSGTVTTILQPFTSLNTNPGTGSSIYLSANAFYGESMAGSWRLYMYDHYTDYSQFYLGSWAVDFFYR